MVVRICGNCKSKLGYTTPSGLIQIEFKCDRKNDWTKFDDVCPDHEFETEQKISGLPKKVIEMSNGKRSKNSPS